MPIRILLIFQLTIGIVLMVYFIYLFKNEIYPDLWTFAGPLLSLSLIVNSITGAHIKNINLIATSGEIEINKVKLTSISSRRISIDSLKPELKSPNARGLFTTFLKLRLEILENGKIVEEIKSNLFSMNNEKLKEAYGKLKELSKKKI